MYVTEQATLKYFALTSNVFQKMRFYVWQINCWNNIELSNSCFFISQWLYINDCKLKTLIKNLEKNNIEIYG